MFKDITIACINTLTLTALLFIYHSITGIITVLQTYSEVQEQICHEINVTVTSGQERNRE